MFLAVSKGELFLCCEMDKTKSQPALRLKVSTPVRFPVPSATPVGEAETRVAVTVRTVSPLAGHQEHLLQEASEEELPVLLGSLSSKSPG